MKIFKFAASSALFLVVSTALAIAEPRDMTAWTAPEDAMIPSAAGPLPVIIRRLTYSWKHSEAFSEFHNVVAVVVPSQNLYWFGDRGRTQTFENRTIDRKFFVFNNCLIGVVPDRGNMLTFSVSHDRLASPNVTRELSAALTKRLQLPGIKKFDSEEIIVRTEEVLGMFPFTGNGDSRGEPAADITVSKITATNFTIEFAGGDKNSIKASITFNNAFEPITATLKGKQVFSTVK